MNKHLSTAIHSILKSLIGLLFRSGISFGEFSELAKKAYVKEVENELLKSGEKTTTSKIAIITGLTRKEVAAIRQEKTIRAGLSQQHNRAVRVISGWLNDDAFSNKKNKARVLAIQDSQGSFQELVSKYSGDIPYRAMLNELIRTGAVELIDSDNVKLIQAAYIPVDNENEKLALLGEDVSLLISTIKHNIIKPSNEAFFQRKVSYNNIPAKYIEDFKCFAKKENQALLEKLNDWLANHDKDQSPVQEPVKVGVGVYYFEEKRAT